MSSGNPSLAVEVAGIRFGNPLILASGILGVTASSLARAVRFGAGGVSAKSCSLEPRCGHPGPVILPFAHGMLNAVGLANPGVAAAVEELLRFRELCDAPLIASVFAADIDQFGEVTRRIVEGRPDMIEVNVSCPNVAAEFGAPFGADFRTTAAVTRVVRKAAGAIPVSIKLTVACPSLAEMARVCAGEGADAITAINTVGPGMIIDPDVARPVLSNRTGGVSGPAVLPIAVRAVYEIRSAVALPIIGTGGISTAGDVLQMMMAGADAVGIGTAVRQGGLEIFNTINRDLLTFMTDKKFNSLAQIKGIAHE